MAARCHLGLRAAIALASMCVAMLSSRAHAGGMHSCCRADGSCVVLGSDDDTCITFVLNDACSTPCPQPEACCDDFTGVCMLTLTSLCQGTFPGSPTCAPGTCDIGACCDSVNGTCSITGPSGCLDSYLSGEACTPNPCVGACCDDADGSCSVTTASLCGGTFMSGQMCSSNPCPIGACCDDFDATCTTTGPGGCFGMFYLGQSCGSNPCESGTCCDPFDGACMITGPLGCSGTYTAFQVCSPNPCETGACCDTNTGDCIITGPTGCFPGDYRGAFTTCAPNPCFGACCDTLGGCVESPNTLCYTFMYNQTCTPNPCTQPSTCCQDDGSCTVIALDQACGFGTPNASSSCMPNPCQQPTACCDAMSACSLTPVGASCPPGSQPNSSTTCSPNPCSQPSVCCNDNNNTCSLTPAGVPCPAGHTPNVATSCTPTNPCPQFAGACCDGSSTCHLATFTACTGTWLGGPCFPNNPCPGACCTPSSDTCAIGLQTSCEAAGGVFVGGSCPLVCPVACCDSTTGVCTLVDPVSCAGTAMNSSCTPDPCAKPKACCDASAGTCSVAAPGASCIAPAVPAALGFQSCAPDPCTYTMFACCTGTACSLTTRPSCTGTIPTGDPISCTPNPCAGACCSSIGECSIATQSTCVGVFRGTGTTCSSGSCLGACCTPDAVCTQFIDRSPCVGVGGQFYFNQTCTPTYPCGIGACCHPTNGACTITTPSACAGGYRGDGVLCALVSCPVIKVCCATANSQCTVTGPTCPSGTIELASATMCAPNPCTGACCNATMICVLTTPADCTGQFVGGTCIIGPKCHYACCDASGACTLVPVPSCAAGGGLFATCTPNPCAIACCDTATGACTLGAPGCLAGSTPHINVACASDPCPRSLCCDDATGACSLGALAGCPPGATRVGMGTSCSPDPCLGACCSDTSTCSFVLRGACPPGGFFLGVSCMPNPCAGACCETNGSCGLSTQSACSGNFLGGSCSPNPCPQPIACCDDLTGVCSVSTACPPGTAAASPTSSSCSPSPCPGGACCINCMDCIVTLPATCATQGGVFKGAGVACVGNCPLINGGFETGDFSGWTEVMPGSAYVATSIGPVSAHGGSHFAVFQSVDARTGIKQVVTALPGDSVHIDFWYRVFSGGTPNSFLATFEGVTLLELIDDTTNLTWAHFQFDVTVMNTSPVLQFLSANLPDAAFLDDVRACVTPMEACCDLASGACTPVALGTCTGAGQGHGVICSPNPCAPPTACCNSASGSCSIAPPLTACPTGTTAASPTTSTCTSTTCPQGACCNSTTNICTLTAPGGCSGGAAFKGLGITCNPHPCPPVLMPVDGGVTLDSRGMCNTTAEAIAFVAGAFTAAPNCPLAFTVSPPPPYSIGTTPIVLTATDCNNLSTSVNTSITILGVDCNNNTIPDTCECFWNNGVAVTPAAAGINDGQLSHIGGGAGIGFTINSGQRVADDFYVCPNQMHHIYGFCGWMYTNSLPGLRKARLDFFEDCNGVPSLVPFRSSTNSVVISTTPATGGFDLVQYCFEFCTDPLWLDGGSNGKSYWVSLQGVTDNQGTDTSFWVAVPGARTLLGSVPVKAVGAYAPLPATPIWGPWAAIADCCIGCVNMAFSLQGESCPFIWNNGGPDLGAGRGGSPSMDVVGGVQTRTADDFVTRTCADQEICYIDAWIWTNCTPAIGFIEIYRNTCAFATHDHADPLLNRPAGNLPESAPFLTLTPTKVIATGQTATINGVLMNGYQLQFYPPPNVIIPAGETLYISAGGKNLGNVGGRAYFAYAADCNRACAIRLNPGVTRSLVPSQSTQAEWQPTMPPRDFAFRIAVRYAPFIFGAAAGGSPRPIGCPIDINNDQNINTQDIFDYLNAWFGGCP